MNVAGIISAGAIFLAATLSAFGQTQAQPTDDFTLCQGVPGMPQQQSVAPCTRVIDNPHTTKDRLGAALLQRCRLGREGFTAAAALKDCSRAVSLMPKSADAYEARAEIYENMSNYEKAIADLTMAIKYDDRPTFDYFSRGRVFNERAEYERFFPKKQTQRAQDYDNAIVDLNKVLEAKAPPGASADGEMILGVLQGWAKDEIAKAQKGKDETVKVGAVDPRSWCKGEGMPTDGPPFDYVVLACTAVIDSSAMTKAEKGEAYFRRARARAEEGPEQMVLLGGLLQQRIGTGPDNTALNDVAVRDYRKAIELGAEVAQAHYGMGIVLLIGGKFDQAQAEFTKAIALKGPDLARYYDARGEAEFYRGQLAAARADIDRSLQLKPDDASVFLDRSNVRDMMGDYDGALADCARAVSLAQDIFPIGPYSTVACGDAYFHKGDYRRAIAQYDSALNIDAQMKIPDALYGRGAAKLRAGDKEGGQADLDEAIKLDAEIVGREQKKKIAP